jgi:hypothetical protein
MIPEPITVAASRSEPKSDRAKFFAQRHGVQRLDWQRDEELDPGFHLLECLTERERLIRIGAFDRRRIPDAPVRRHGFSRPYWTHLAGGVIADRKDKVDRRRIGRRELIPALAAQALRG